VIAKLRVKQEQKLIATLTIATLIANTESEMRAKTNSNTENKTESEK